MWNARRILKELADPDRRRTILTHFWKHADAHHRAVVQAHLARAMNFREETIRKMPPEKKADLLASRISCRRGRELSRYRSRRASFTQRG